MGNSSISSFSLFNGWRHLEPGVAEVTAARIHALLPGLYKAAEGLSPLADKGYIGAGIGIRIVVRRGRSEEEPHVGHPQVQQAAAAHESSQRAHCRRAQAAMTSCPAVRHGSAPSQIGNIARAPDGIWK